MENVPTCRRTLHASGGLGWCQPAGGGGFARDDRQSCTGAAERAMPLRPASGTPGATPTVSLHAPPLTTRRASDFMVCRFPNEVALTAAHRGNRPEVYSGLVGGRLQLRLWLAQARHAQEPLRPAAVAAAGRRKSKGVALGVHSALFGHYGGVVDPAAVAAAGRSGSFGPTGSRPVSSRPSSPARPGRSRPAGSARVLPRSRWSRSARVHPGRR